MVGLGPNSVLERAARCLDLNELWLLLLLNKQYTVLYRAICELLVI